RSRVRAKRTPPCGAEESLFDCSLSRIRSSARMFFMDPLRELGRMLLVLGVLLVFLGAPFYFRGKLPLRLGRLPADIVHRGEHTTFSFPLATCLVLRAA